MTIDQTNISIYKSLYQHKALTEKIIGTTDYAFQYAVASYKAVCTEGIDFTMFDKVICGILQIDEVSGFEEIADILGLNVVHKPEEEKYIDFGEKEILEYAIKSLIDFNMIEIDDIYYSRCRLTEIGKDYAKQGKKFLPATPKEFKIYYDLTDQRHQEAKKRFGKLTGVRQSSSLNFEVNDEVFVKEVAKTQTPEIYNPSQLRNFTGLELRAIDVFSVTFKVAGLVSIKDNSVRFLAFDDKQNLNQSISDIIEENTAIKSELLEKLLTQYEAVPEKRKSDSQKQYESEIIAHQQEVETLLSQKQGEKAFIKMKEVYSKSNIIEESYFDLNFKDFFDEISNEFWIIFTNFSERRLEGLKTIISGLGEQNHFFVILPTSINEDIENAMSNLSEKYTNFYFDIIDFESINSTLIFSKKGNDKKHIVRQSFILNCQTEKGLKSYEYPAYFIANEWSNDISEVYKQSKALFTESYWEIVTDKVDKEINDFMRSPKLLTKQVINNLEAHSGRLRVFRNEKDFAQLINEFYKTSKEKIAGLKELLTFKIETEVMDVESSLLVEEANFSISELREFEDKLHELKTNLYDENTVGYIKIKNLEDLINSQIQALCKLEKKLTPKPKNQKSYSIKNKK